MSILFIIGFGFALWLGMGWANEEMKKDNWLSHWFDKK